MKLSRLFFYSLISLILVQCESTPEPIEKPLPKSVPQYYRSGNQNSKTYNDIDVSMLIEELELDQPIQQIGYKERRFNTCNVESNQSDSPRCRPLFLGRVNFQIMCRDSTGTVERVRLTPFNSKRLRWKSHGKRGSAQTDINGFGQISFVSKNSNARGHLYLYLGSKVARKSFHDKWKLILPKSWCNSQ